jgi:hypothetical protein
MLSMDQTSSFDTEWNGLAAAFARPLPTAFRLTHHVS